MLNRIIKKLKHNKKRGFTLIELMVIIAILAMLTAILIPSMIGYLNNAKKATANANARTIYIAAAAAITDCTASGNAGSIANITNSEVSALKTGSEFEKRIAVMLGDTFTGKISVNIESGNITSAQWSDNIMTGSYTVN